MDICSTCTSIFPYQIPSSAETFRADRVVPCCGRIICGKCMKRNIRFAGYCPYCQVSNTATSLPQRLKDPPSYTHVPLSSARTAEFSSAPPLYTLDDREDKSKPLEIKEQDLGEVEKVVAKDTLHFLNHEHDSIISLSFRYGVPVAALRRANNITSDHLLSGRRTISIPGEFYKVGVSLSPRPVEGEEDELRKNKIRRFMTSCKVSDYDIAVLYLEQSNYDLGASVEAYLGDEAWESEHPANGLPTASLKHKTRSPFWRGLNAR